MKTLKQLKTKFINEEIAESLFFPNEMKPLRREVFIEGFRQFRKKPAAKESAEGKLTS